MLLDAASSAASWFRLAKGDRFVLPLGCQPTARIQENKAKKPGAKENRPSPGIPIPRKAWNLRGALMAAGAEKDIASNLKSCNRLHVMRFYYPAENTGGPLTLGF